MKRIVIGGLIIFATGLLAPQIILAQGTTTFLSNLGQVPTGSNPVGNDSWLAAAFFTGNSIGGYLFNSIQLGIADASGSPSGFTVMVYSEIGGAGVNPGSSLGTLSGPANPGNSGAYTYTSSSDISLSPSTAYFIVVTAGTTVANGAYEWNFLNASTYQPVDSWTGSVTLSSANGSSWTRLGSNPNYDFSQFALSATPVPEPGAIGLLAMGGLLAGFCHWKARSV
jgi:hypothetical protein